MGLTLVQVLGAAPALGNQDAPSGQGLETGAGQPSDVQVDPALKSPRATMFTFLGAINDYTNADSAATKKRAIEKAIECLDLEPGLPAETKRNIAFDLYTVIGRIGEVQPFQLPESLEESSFVFYPQKDWKLPYHQTS